MGQGIIKAELEYIFNVVTRTIYFLIQALPQVLVTVVEGVEVSKKRQPEVSQDSS